MRKYNFVSRRNKYFFHKIQNFSSLEAVNTKIENDATISSPIFNKLEYDNAKSFLDIPGPVGFPIFGNLLDYKLGRFTIASYQDALLERYSRYGSVVRENFGHGRKVIHLFDPADAKRVFQAEGKIPYIMPLQETTQMYRVMRKLSLGLGNMNGDDWYRLRSAVQQMMMRPKSAQNFLPLSETVARDFVTYIHRNRDTKLEVKNFRNLVLQWSLESSANIVFETRLDCLGASANSLAQRLIDANQLIFYLSGLLKFSLPIFKIISTPKWRKLVKAEDFFYNEAGKLIDKTVREVRRLIDCDSLNDGQFLFMCYMLSRKELSALDLAIISLSLFADGLNTTAPTLIYNLYCLANNLVAQDKLRKEVEEKLGKISSTVTPEQLNSMPYLKACIKEAFRLFPIGTEISRIPQTNLVLGGYQVPAGTPVDINMSVHFRSSKYFSEPDLFLPERWLRGQTIDKELHPYLLLPFGFGPRMCAGRRFAEQDLQLALSLLISRFQIKHSGSPMRQKMWTLLLPDGDTQFQFIDLKK